MLALKACFVKMYIKVGKLTKEITKNKITQCVKMFEEFKSKLDINSLLKEDLVNLKAANLFFMIKLSSLFWCYI